MQEVQDTSTSWLLRTHFSRGIRCTPASATSTRGGSVAWLNLHSTTESISKPVEINCTGHEGTVDDIGVSPASIIEHAPSLSAYCQAEIHDLFNSGMPKTVDQHVGNNNDDILRLSTQSSGGEFSFASSASSSRNSTSSKTPSLGSTENIWFMPQDELQDLPNLRSSTEHDNDHNITTAQLHTTGQHHSSNFLRSMFSSLSLSRHHHSRPSSSSSCNSTIINDQKPDLVHVTSNKPSLLKRLSFISPPLASPTGSPVVLSPTKGSPLASPKADSTPTSSPRDYSETDYTGHHDCASQDYDYHDSMPSMRRVPSWSHHLSDGDDGEKAVLSAEKWMADLSQLLIGERFASGRHSRLYHGIYMDSPVAVKVIRPPDEDETLGDRVEQIFNQEVITLSRLQHHNIIKFLAACRKPPLLCVITEYLPGGSLRSFLHKREGQLLPISKVVQMALDIAYGMEYIHTMGIIHRDLKSENLVLDKDGSIKIVDFGVSCFESECSYRLDDLGTYRWMAPEMLSHKPHSRKVDVYSFGIVLWELLTTQLPYEDMAPVQAAYSVINQNNRPPIPSACPPTLAELMSQCWSSDPTIRPEFFEILRSLNLYKDTLGSELFSSTMTNTHT